MPITLDQAIDTVMKLSVDEQELLVEIVQHRTVAERRRKMAEDAQISLGAFRSGTLKPQTADEIIAELRSTEDELDDR